MGRVTSKSGVFFFLLVYLYFKQILYCKQKWFEPDVVFVLVTENSSCFKKDMPKIELLEQIRRT